MRILILAVFASTFVLTNFLAVGSAFSAIDHSRLEKEMDFLKSNAFLDEAKKEISRQHYFDRSKDAISEVPSNVIDLDQEYFSDSISSGLAAPEKETSGK